jgi:Xaa-Pro dipeptidase
MDQSEDTVAAALLDAQGKAEDLFAAIESQNLIRPGVPETKINQDIYALAERMFGIARYWHNRIVRAGRNWHPAAIPVFAMY